MKQHTMGHIFQILRVPSDAGQTKDSPKAAEKIPSTTTRIRSYRHQVWRQLQNYLSLLLANNNVPETFTFTQHDFSYVGDLQIMRSEYVLIEQPRTQFIGTSRICVHTVKLITSDYLLWKLLMDVHVAVAKYFMFQLKCYCPPETSQILVHNFPKTLIYVNLLQEVIFTSANS
jgi:hypothetical protein